MNTISYTDITKTNKNIDNNKIKENNLKFDNKLKQKGLIDFIRKSDYINGDTEILLFHIKCRRVFSIKPNYFFKRKHKCLHCYKQELKSKKKSIPKNDFYQDKINKLTNNEFKLLSNYYNSNSYIKLQHIVCGHIFETRADNFEIAKKKCPKCANRENYHTKTFLHRVKEIEELLDNKYEIVSKIFSSDSNIRIRHKSCGKEFECSVSSIIKSKNKKRVRVKCPKCDLERRRDEFLDKLDRIQGNEFKIRGAYKGLRIPTKFYHKKCNNTFIVSPYYFLKHKIEYCPECREYSREIQFKKRLQDKYGDDFELISKYESSNKRVTLKHKACGSIFETYSSNLFNGSYPCKSCLNKVKSIKKKEKYKQKINEIYNKKFNFTGEYLGIKTKTEFHCNLCNNTFKETPDIMLQGKKKCPYCK